MLAQEVITKPVIDSGLRISPIGVMLTHDQILEELFRQIGEGKFTQAAIAKYLKIPASRITDMKKGVRRIQQHEMPLLADLLGMTDRAPSEGDVVQSTSYIPNLGRVAQGVWMEQTDEREGVVAYDRLKGDPSPTDLFAVTPEGASMNLRFPAGTRLICRRVPFGVGQFRSGDYVIARRSAHDLYEMTCKRVEVDGDGVYWLHSESSDPKFAEPWEIGRPSPEHHDDNEIEVVAKVIRAVLDFENPNQFLG